MENNSSKSYNKVHGVFLVIFMLLSVTCGIYAIIAYKDYARGVGSLAFTLIPLLLPIVRKALKFNKATKIEIILMMFTIFAFHIGVVVGLYAVFSPFDNIMHCLSGVVFVYIGICVAFKLQAKRSSVGDGFNYNFNFYAFFGFCFAQTGSVVWEIFEYSGFILVGHDAQHSLTTGVVDTMQDLIVCFIGGLVCCIVLILVNKYNKNSVILSPLKEFYEVNK